MPRRDVRLQRLGHPQGCLMLSLSWTAPFPSGPHHHHSHHDPQLHLLAVATHDSN